MITVQFICENMDECLNAGSFDGYQETVTFERKLLVTVNSKSHASTAHGRKRWTIYQTDNGLFYKWGNHVLCSECWQNLGEDDESE